MMARPARLLGAAVLVLFASAAGARADVSLFGAYWDNVARATAQNDAYKVLQLVGRGSDSNEVDDVGRTGLQLAAINGNLQIAAILIKASAHLDLKDRLGNTALHYAADRNISRWRSSCSMPAPRSTPKTRTA
jgi:ankyrin repeat protein